MRKRNRDRNFHVHRTNDITRSVLLEAEVLHGRQLVFECRDEIKDIDGV